MSNIVRRFGTQSRQTETTETTTKDEMIEAQELPVGPKPGWELDQPVLDEENALPLMSTSER